MLVAAQKWLRAKRIVPANRWLKVDTFGTGRTQERRRPDRTGETPVRPSPRKVMYENGNG